MFQEHRDWVLRELTVDVSWIPDTCLNSPSLAAPYALPLNKSLMYDTLWSLVCLNKEQKRENNT